jgi:Cdc6-like AAA superfamily ATPase
MEMSEKQDLSLQAGRVFTPATPVDERALFAGRDLQVRQVVEAITQKGQHAIVFGERGVGKTSLANVFSSFLSQPADAILATRVNCDTMDNFDTVWRKALEQFQLTTHTLGFNDRKRSFTSAELLGDPVRPDGVRRVLSVVAQTSLPILIIDEFDRLPEQARRGFADTIKTLSDHAVRATVVLVGVADTVDQLIREHQSIERALVQIRMPRMSREEVEEIVSTGLKRLEMEIDPAAMRRICVLSQGLPHYTHLLCLHASRAALEGDTLTISEPILDEAIKRAIDGAQHSIRNAWHEAVRSARKDSLFADVLLACALAESDELGFFAAQDVRVPLKAITGKKADIPTFARHLNEFCEIARGPILQKAGHERRYRYRFVNPLMQPFVVMNGVLTSRIAKPLLDRLPGS